MTKSVKRLFKDFQPHNYNLSLQLNRQEMTFVGEIEISGKKTGRPSSRITLHQKGLNFTHASITKIGKASEEIEVSRINTQQSFDEVRLHTDSQLYPGEYIIRINFDGKIVDNMVGIYPSYFMDRNTKDVLFATQFESHHAREAFPCIDEPEAKATFCLTLDTETGVEVISNTNIAEQTKKGDRLITTFEQTPIMSSYLLAFVVGHMHSVEAQTSSGITVRSWATKAQTKDKLQFSVDEGVKILEFFEDYFKTPFPLKKCDQVALPDFESGAMENWGLITYREIALLTDPSNRSVSSEQYVALVIAHELSHQWFGNLVTMKWWDDLWLNESFASIMEHLALDALHPDWHQWEHYTSQDVLSASNRDVYSDVQAVGVDVKHPDEIGALFDPAIVYAKGGRLIKMLREYIGDEAFRAGLATYFKTHAYKNTYRDDLWDAFSASSGKDVKSLMTPWLVQSGMPVLRVSGSEDNSRSINQERFLLEDVSSSQLWPVPLLGESKLEPEIISQSKSTVSFTSHTLPVINATGSGHYVVNYENPGDFNSLLDKVTTQTISSEGRINILNDLILLAKRGDISIVDSLRLLSKMKNERREPVWSMMSRALGVSYSLGEFDTTIEAGYRKLSFDISKDLYAELGWDDIDGEDPNTTLLRSIISSIYISSEDPTILEFVKGIYQSTPIDDIPADRRGSVLGSAVRHIATEDVITTLIEKYKTTPDPDLQLSISSALTFTKDEAVALRLLKEGFAENDGFIRHQDYFRWFAYLNRNKYTRSAIWDWMVENWDRIYRDFSGGKSLDVFVTYSAAPIQTEEGQKAFNEFFADKTDIVSISRNIAIAKSEIAARVAWRNRELPKLQQFYSDYVN